MNEKLEIFTDGACRGNPGPGGWGALLRYRDKEKSIKGGELDTTNNRMELTATIEALKCLKQKSQVKLTTDSNYVKNGITVWIHSWLKNNWRTSNKKPVKNADLWQTLHQLNQQHDIEWCWVKGHSGHPENDYVDELANRAIDELQQG